MAVAQVDVVEHARARIAHVQEEVRQLRQLGDVGQLPSGIHVAPCQAELQSLLNAEVSIVQALVHAPRLVEALRFLLKHIPCEVEPFGQDVVDVIGRLACRGHFVLQAQGQDASHADARGPPVMPHGVERMDARRFQHPVAQARVQGQPLQPGSYRLSLGSGQFMIHGVVGNGGEVGFMSQSQVRCPYRLPSQHLTTAPRVSLDGLQQYLLDGFRITGILRHQIGQRQVVQLPDVLLLQLGISYLADRLPCLAHGRFRVHTLFGQFYPLRCIEQAGMLHPLCLRRKQT